MSLGIFSISDTIYFKANTVDRLGSAIDATTGPTFSVYKNNGSTILESGTMSKIGSNTGCYEASFQTEDFTEGQHFILIEATVDGQTPKAFHYFQIMKDAESVSETFGRIKDMSDSLPSIGDGSVSVDHNFGGTDVFRVTTSANTPISSVIIKAFVKSDYDAGRKSNQYVVGQTKTKTDGRWQQSIYLDPGDYTLEFKKGSYLSSVTNITVS